MSLTLIKKNNAILEIINIIKKHDIDIEDIIKKYTYSYENKFNKLDKKRYKDNYLKMLSFNKANERLIDIPNEKSDEVLDKLFNELTSELSYEQGKVSNKIQDVQIEVPKKVPDEKNILYKLIEDYIFLF